MVSHNFFTLIIFIGIMGAGTIIHYIVLSASESEDDPPFFAIPWAEKTHQEGVEISAGGSRSKSPHGPSLSRLAEIWGFLFEHMVPPKNLQVWWCHGFLPVDLNKNQATAFFFKHEYEVSSSFWTNPGLLQLSGGQMIATRGALAPERWESTLCWWEFWSKVVESQRRPWGS